MATVPGKNPGILLELFAVVQASERNEGREGKEMEREKGRERERERERERWSRAPTTRLRCRLNLTW